MDHFQHLSHQHDWRLVALAAMVCIAAAMVAVVFLRNARGAKSGMSNLWLLTSGIATGLGVWATHFIAMLGYHPGVPIGYRPFPTILSLIVAIAMTSAGTMLAGRRDDRLAHAGAATIIGAGIAAMHYIGMSAAEFPGDFHWSGQLVMLSIVAAILPTYAALRLAITSRGSGSGGLAATALALGVVLLHFTGMAAVTLVPGPTEPHSASLLSPIAMSIGIASVTFLVIIGAMAAMLLSRRAEDALEASEREFHILAKGVTDCAIYMLDARGMVANWNAGAARLKGYPAKEAVGLPLSTFYTAEDRDDFMPDKALAIARTQGCFHGEGWRVRKDGTRFWAHVTIEPVLEEDGHLRGFAKITRDMTRLKQDQDRLADVTRNLDAALSHMTQGLCLFDAEHRLVLTNLRFAEMWLLPPMACRPGMKLGDVAHLALTARTGQSVPEERLNRLLGEFSASLAEADSPPMIMDLGDAMVIAVISRQLPDGGFVATFEDVTALHLATRRIAVLETQQDIADAA